MKIWLNSHTNYEKNFSRENFLDWLLVIHYQIPFRWWMKTFRWRSADCSSAFVIDFLFSSINQRSKWTLKCSCERLAVPWGHCPLVNAFLFRDHQNVPKNKFWCSKLNASKFLGVTRIKQFFEYILRTRRSIKKRKVLLKSVNLGLFVVNFCPKVLVSL